MRESIPYARLNCNFTANKVHKEKHAMIPKIIHYCWFGGKELPPLAQKCIASWKKYCPDYEIIRWDESNFDLDQTPYTRWCYDNGKWAFLSDYVRLAVVAEHGGVYFDTDVELIKNPDQLLQYEAFYGFENHKNVATGLGFGAQAQHPTLEAMKQQYLDLTPDETGAFPLQACPALNTAALLPLGLKRNGERQNVLGAEILPVEFLNPYNDNTGLLQKSKNTLSIHWYSKSWLTPAQRLRSILTKPFHRLFGTNCFAWLKRK